MSMLCAIIGHSRRGYAHCSIGYGKARRFAIDGTGREHWVVEGECDRCGRTFDMAMFHASAALRQSGADERGETA